jgi:hypothetical protein
MGLSEYNNRTPSFAVVNMDHHDQMIAYDTASD